MKSLFVLLVAFGGAAPVYGFAASTLVCQTSEENRIKIILDGPMLMRIQFLTGASTGRSATLYFTRKVRPGGRLFYRYSGQLDDGKGAMTYYLSADLKTLTRLRYDDPPVDYSCQRFTDQL